MRDLLTDYHARRPELMQFYAVPPEAVFNGLAKPRWDRSLVDAINASQERLGATARIAGNETVIVTGQQPGLLTGPLYTIYKAVTAINLARAVHERTGAPCVPLFWVAGDDHDFEETGHVHLLTKHHQPLRLAYTPSADIAGMSMHRVPLEPSLHALVDAAADAALASEHAAGVRAFLHDSLDASASFSDWTARLLARLFVGTPLVVFSPDLPEARALARPVVAAAIRSPLLVTEVLRDTAARIEAAGYAPQVEKRPGECAFFLESEGRRRKVVFRDGHFILPATRQSFTQDELLALLDKSPEIFSPNVALRCAVQQQLLPASAYVAGPGELAYWAQLGPVFKEWGLRPPAVYPRARCVITYEKSRKLLDESGFTAADAAGSVEELTARALRNTAESPALNLVRARRTVVEDEIRRLADDLAPLDVQAADMAGHLRNQLAGRMDRLEWVIARGDEAHRRAVRERVLRVTNELAPGRKPQERVYSVFSYLFDQGWPLVGRLLDEVRLDRPTVQEVQL